MTLSCRSRSRPFQSDLKKALTAVGVREGVKPEGCLEGDPNKRTVCTFKLGSFMTIMADSKKGEKDIVAITMICGAQTPSDMGKCLLAYMGAMSMATPGLAVETRGKIVSILTSGLEVGNETFVRTEERSYSLQKSIGLWFHVIAADGEGD